MTLGQLPEFQRSVAKQLENNTIFPSLDDFLDHPQRQDPLYTYNNLALLNQKNLLFPVDLDEPIDPLTLLKSFFRYQTTHYLQVSAPSNVYNPLGSGYSYLTAIYDS